MKLTLDRVFCTDCEEDYFIQTGHEFCSYCGCDNLEWADKTKEYTFELR